MAPNGSPHARQARRDWHGVLPNALSSRVS